VAFVRSFHTQHRTVPTINTILQNSKMNRSKFYELFPGKLGEVCRLAGVPVPEDRIQAVRQALESRSSQRKEEATSPSQECLMLSHEATKRVYGICQLEGGLEPSLVIDKLLDLDTRLRRNYRLSLAKTKQLSDFLDSAISRGWKVDSLVDYLVKVWNSGILNLTEPCLRNMISLVQGIDLNYWGSVQNFIQYATRHYAAIANYRTYAMGGMSLEQFLRAEGLGA